MGVKTFDFKKVALTINNQIVSGFADGTGINVEFNEDQFSLSVGSDGEAIRSDMNNESGSMTITLQASSAFNAVLSGLSKAKTIFDAQVKDTNGDTLAAGEFWVKTRPSVEFGREAADREWVLETGALKMDVGGLS